MEALDRARNATIVKVVWMLERVPKSVALSVSLWYHNRHSRVQTDECWSLLEGQSGVSLACFGSVHAWAHVLSMA